MRSKTKICIICNVNIPFAGKVCEKCRYQKRKDYYKEYNSQYKRLVGRREYKDRAKALNSQGNFCQSCSWKDEPAILEVHHIDCNNKNHAEGNLIILCPNCHQLTHYKNKTSSWRLQKLGIPNQPM